MKTLSKFQYFIILFLFATHQKVESLFHLKRTTVILQRNCQQIDASSNNPIFGSNPEHQQLPYTKLSTELQRHETGIKQVYDVESSTNHQFRPVWSARLVSWILRKVVESNIESETGLQVNMMSESNIEIIKGRVDTLEVKFDKISCSQIRVSGGGRIMLQGIDLKMRRFLFENLQSLRKPYRMYCDLMLTQSDIVNSKFIRYWLQYLLNNILSSILSQATGTLAIELRKVTIRNERLYAHGQVTVGSSGPSMAFEVSTCAGIREGGQVLCVNGIEVILNPDSALRASLPVILMDTIDVDLGAECRLENLEIRNKSVWLRGVTVISPIPEVPSREEEEEAVVTSKVQPASATSASAAASVPSARARFQYNLASLLSTVLILRGGVIPAWVNCML